MIIPTIIHLEDGGCRDTKRGTTIIIPQVAATEGIEPSSCRYIS